MAEKTKTKTKKSEPAPLATKTNAATVAETAGVARKGVPGIRIYSTIFPGVLAETGKPATVAVLFDLARVRIEAVGPAGVAYVADGSLLSRVRAFFREASNRVRGVPTTKPFPVPGRSGGIVFGPRTASGEATLVYSATAEKVEAPSVVGLAEAKTAKTAKTAK